jgi:hypothetical protein
LGSERRRRQGTRLKETLQTKNNKGEKKEEEVNEKDEEDEEIARANTNRQSFPPEAHSLQLPAHGVAYTQNKCESVCSECSVVDDVGSAWETPRRGCGCEVGVDDVALCESDDVGSVRGPLRWS